MAGKGIKSFLGGARDDLPGLKILPGAQFVVAGLVAKPNSFYRVLTTRMLLDLVVYLAMLAVFSTLVLFHDIGTMTWGGNVFAIHVFVGSSGGYLLKGNMFFMESPNNRSPLRM